MPPETVVLSKAHAFQTQQYRWSVGVQVASDGRSLSAALVAAEGRGGEVRPRLAAEAAVALDDEVAVLIRDAKRLNVSCGGLLSLRRHLSDAEAAIVQELLDGARMPSRLVDAVGVCDPGIWYGERHTRLYASLCDPARLASATRLNVVDAFAADDLAAGGRGGPLLSVPLWALLRDENRPRALLDVGRTLRLLHLPGGFSPSAADHIVGVDLGPGTALLDLFARRLTAGQHPYDAGGTLAVQGRRIRWLLAEWIDQWLRDDDGDPWSPLGIDPKRYFETSVSSSVDASWTVGDLLCTATHFLAAIASHGVRERFKSLDRVAELIVSGGGRQNGLLLREIQRRLPDIKVFRVEEVGYMPATLEAAAVALLARFAIDRFPAHGRRLTGATSRRPLGRFTPGTAEHWHKLAGVSPQPGDGPAWRPAV